MQPNPTDEQRYDVPDTKRQATLDALDHAQGFLLVGGLDAEQRQAQRVRTAFSEVPADEPVTLQEVDAARAVAALVAYREYLLDEGNVADAAEVEGAIRTFAEQNAALAQMTEDAL